MLRKSVETRDWLNTIEPRNVRAVMKRVVEDITAIDTQVHIHFMAYCFSSLQIVSTSLPSNLFPHYYNNIAIICFVPHYSYPKYLIQSAIR